VWAIGRPAGISSSPTRTRRLESSTRCALAFGLGRQLFPCPGRVREGVVVRHVHDRVVFETGDWGLALWQLGGGSPLDTSLPPAPVHQ